MQAILVRRFGGPGVLRPGRADLPVPGPGELLIRVLAAGVGPWDVSLRRGGWDGPLPCIPGREFAGVVVGETGIDAGFAGGTPVYGYPGLTGCYAQYVACDVERLAPIPAGLRVTDAAATPVAALTAEQGLTDVLGLRAGDQILITEAAGGVGHFAVQIARALGATVAATAGPRSIEYVHRLGAAIVADHTEPGWPGQVRAMLDGGAERVLACGAGSLAGAARAARAGAMVATPVPGPLPSVNRVRWQQYDGLPRGSRLVRMAPWFDDGRLSVQLSGRYYWREAAHAHREFERHHPPGKLVLIMDEDLAAALEV